MTPPPTRVRLRAMCLRAALWVCAAYAVWCLLVGNLVTLDLLLGGIPIPVRARP